MKKFNCILCDFHTNHKPNFERHLGTTKHLKKNESHPKVTIESPESHLKVTFDTPKSHPKVTQKSAKNNLFCTKNQKKNEPLEEKNDIHQCKYCLKEFKHKQGMYRHIKYVCKKNKDEDFKELARLMNEQHKQMELIHEEQQKTTKKLLFKDKELQKMQKQIERLTTKLQIQNINNGVIHQNQNNVVNIQLLNHTETDYSHLTHKDYVMCIHDCNKCVKSMIEKVHFNKDKPENRNIYISNIKGKYIMIYKDNAWQIIDKKEQLDDMYDYNEMVLEFWYDEYKTKYPDIVKSFQRYLKNKDGNDVLNKVKDEILMMLYNKRNMIMIE